MYDLKVVIFWCLFWLVGLDALAYFGGISPLLPYWILLFSPLRFCFGIDDDHDERFYQDDPSGPLGKTIGYKTRHLIYWVLFLAMAVFHTFVYLDGSFFFAKAMMYLGL